jgi:hypothetical protein
MTWASSLRWAVLLLVAAATIVAESKRVVGNPDALEAEDNACSYDDAIGFEAGDKVRLQEPNTTGHNSIAVVACPGDCPSGRVRLAEEEDAAGVAAHEGCFEPSDLRKTSHLCLALGEVLSRVKQFAGNTAKRAAGVFLQALGSFASATLHRLVALSKRFLAALNICDKDVQKTVQGAFSAIRSHLSTMAGVAASAAQAHLLPVLTLAAKTAKAGLSKVGALLVDAAKKKSDAEALKVKQIIDDLFQHIKELVAGALEKHPKISKVVGSIHSFFEQVSKLSSRVEELSRGWKLWLPLRAIARSALAAVEAGGGRLMAAASAQQPAVRAALHGLISASAAKVGELGLKAFQSVNLCIPEKRQQAEEAFSEVTGRVDKLAVAITKRLPAVEERVSELAEEMTQRLSEISEQISLRLPLARQEIEEEIQRIKEKLQGLHKDGTTSAQHLAEHIQADISALMDKIVATGEEAEQQNSDHEIAPADLLPVD